MTHTMSKCFLYMLQQKIDDKVSVDIVNRNNQSAETIMKSPPPCGDITPMEEVSNSRAGPQS